MLRQLVENPMEYEDNDVPSAELLDDGLPVQDEKCSQRSAKNLSANSNVHSSEYTKTFATVHS